MSGRHGRVTRLVSVGAVALATVFDLLVSSGGLQAVYAVAFAVLAVASFWYRLPAWLLGAACLVSTAVALATSADGTPPASFGLAEIVALVLALVVTTRRALGPGSWSTVVLLSVALVTLPARTVSADTVTFVLVFVTLAAIAVASGAVLRNLDAERQSAVARVRQEQRTELAHALHDDLANRITAMVLMLQSVRDRDTPSSADDLGDVERAGTEALETLRQWVRQLQTSGRSDGRPAAADTPTRGLRAVLQEWRTAAPDGRIEVDDRGLRTMPPEVRSVTERVLQEAITNASRHAPASAWIEVVTEAIASGWTVVVRNPVPPGAADALPGSTGLGLVGMRERVSALGGTFRAGTVESDGRAPERSTTVWEVRAEIPGGIAT